MDMWRRNYFVVATSQLSIERKVESLVWEYDHAFKLYCVLAQSISKQVGFKKNKMNSYTSGYLDT